MRDAMVSKLSELATIDKSIILLVGDLGFGVFEKFEAQFPGQYFNAGIGEQNMMGMAAGLALDGKKVFVYSIGNFPTLRCLEQIRNDLCYHGLNVNIIAQGGGFNYGGLGMSHHATEDLSIMRALPGITIVAPSNKCDAAQATEQLYRSPGVGYLRLEKSQLESWNDEAFELGKGKCIKAGSDMTLIAIGGIVSEAYAAASKLKSIDVDCRVIDLHTLKPLDEEIIIKASIETGKIITVEENTLTGGLFGAIAEVAATHHLDVTISKIGMNDCYSSIVGEQKYLRQVYEMDSEAIFICAQKILGRIKS